MCSSKAIKVPPLPAVLQLFIVDTSQVWEKLSQTVLYTACSHPKSASPELRKDKCDRSVSMVTPGNASLMGQQQQHNNNDNNGKMQLAEPFKYSSERTPEVCDTCQHNSTGASEACKLNNSPLAAAGFCMSSCSGADGSFVNNSTGGLFRQHCLHLLFSPAD